MAHKKVARSEIFEVLEVVNYLKDNMMTRGESTERFVEVNEHLLSIEQEIKDIKRRLISLEDIFEKHRTVTKTEFDDLWKRVVAIEKQLKTHR